ncbi:ADP-ribosylglycohydrolase family protein [Methylorubrum extorquens]
MAVGDAIGTTVEFRQRGTFDPVTDMVGGGPFNLKPGHWTDDTSMALCLTDSLIACGRLDERDLLERFYRWWRDGENSVGASNSVRCMSGAAEAANHHRAGHEATNEGHRSCASFPSFRFLSSSPVDLRGRRSRKAPSSSEVDRLVDRRRAHQREERGPRLDSSLLGKKTFHDEEGRGVAVRLRLPATPCDEPRPRPPETGVQSAPRHRRNKSTSLVGDYRLNASAIAYIDTLRTDLFRDSFR